MTPLFPLAPLASSTLPVSPLNAGVDHPPPQDVALPTAEALVMVYKPPEAGPAEELGATYT